MKLLVIVVYMLVSLSALSQHKRFEQEFSKADSAFTVSVQTKADSLLLVESIKAIEALTDKTVTMRASDVLLLYWMGYTDCIIYYNQNGKFSFKELKKQIDRQSLSIRKFTVLKKTDSK